MIRLARLLHLYLAKGGGWIPLAILFLTTPVTAICIFHISAGYSFVRESPQTQGIVKRFNCSKRASECDAVISFTANGATHEFIVQKNPTPSFRSGQIVAIAYQLDSSSNVSAKLVGSPVRFAVFVALAVAILMQAFVIFAIYYTFSVFRRSTRTKRLLHDRAVRPNPSIERTSPGKPGAASHVKR